MKKQAKHYSLIFKIVAILATSFLMFAGFLMLSNTTYNKQKVDAAVTHTLTIVIDDNVTDAYINDGLLAFQYETYNNQTLRVARRYIIEDTEVGMLFNYADEYIFDEYVAHATDDFELIFDGIVGDGFFMPHYDLTIFVKSKLEQFIITINKIIYETKTEVLEPIVEIKKVYPNADFEYEIVVPINYHLYELNGSYFDSDIDNLSLNDNVLSASNIVGNGEINIYLEKNYFMFNIFYGANNEATDRNGGSVTVNMADNMFMEIDSFNDRTYYVYFDTDINLHISEIYGYRFEHYFVFDSSMEQSGYQDISELDENNNFIISNVYSVLNIYVKFIKTYNITASVNRVAIDSQMIKIAEIAFESGSFGTNDLYNTVDTNLYVTYQTKLNQNYARKYEFKRWNVTYKNGGAIDEQTLNELNILQQYNDNTKVYSIKVSNVIADLKIQAIYDVKVFDFNVSWNTFNGKVTADVVGEDYTYKIVFGNSITFTLTPDDDMRFLKSYQLNGGNEFVTENVLEEISLDSTDAKNAKKFRISNITEPLTFKIEFVVNTWWEHLESLELQGKGTSAEPYLVKSASDLALVAYLINNKKVEKDGCVYYAEAYYRLTTDIDCGDEYYFVPIGTLKSQFNGIFDYNYRTISNIWTEKEQHLYKFEGLFDAIGNNGKIINRNRSYLEYALYVLASFAGFGLIVYFVLLAEKIRTKPKKVVYLDGQEEDKLAGNMQKNKTNADSSNTKSKNKILTKEEIMQRAISGKKNNNVTKKD